MEFKFHTPDSLTDNFSPLVLSPVPAGHPQNASDEEEFLDLNDHVKRGSDQIFYIIVKGESMVEFGICDGDLLVADRGRPPKNGDVVIAELDGSFTVKRFMRWQRNLFLVPENGRYKTHRVEEHENFAVWGVVTHVVHRF